MSLGTTPAWQRAWARQRYGSDILLNGQSYRMTTRSLERREHEYLPDGLVNAAASDLRVFLASPTDFQGSSQVTTPPALGSILTWHGADYTLIFAVAGDDDIDGTATTLRLIAYRTPPAGQSPSEAAQIAQWPAPPQ